MHNGRKSPKNLQSRVEGGRRRHVGTQINQILEIAFGLGALMFYVLFYQIRLIPRWQSFWGVIGAALHHVAGWSDFFGIDMGVLIFPLALQDMVMAVWLIVKGSSSDAQALEGTD